MTLISRRARESNVEKQLKYVNFRYVNRYVNSAWPSVRVRWGDKQYRPGTSSTDQGEAIIIIIIIIIIIMCNV